MSHHDGSRHSSHYYSARSTPPSARLNSISGPPSVYCSFENLSPGLNRSGPRRSADTSYPVFSPVRNSPRPGPSRCSFRGSPSAGPSHRSPRIFFPEDQPVPTYGVPRRDGLSISRLPDGILVTSAPTGCAQPDGKVQANIVILGSGSFLLSQSRASPQPGTSRGGPRRLSHSGRRSPHPSHTSPKHVSFHPAHPSPHYSPAHIPLSPIGFAGHHAPIYITPGHQGPRHLSPPSSTRPVLQRAPDSPNIALEIQWNNGAVGFDPRSPPLLGAGARPYWEYQNRIVGQHSPVRRQIYFPNATPSPSPTQQNYMNELLMQAAAAGQQDGMNEMLMDYEAQQAQLQNEQNELLMQAAAAAVQAENEQNELNEQLMQAAAGGMSPHSNASSSSSLGLVNSSSFLGGLSSDEASSLGLLDSSSYLRDSTHDVSMDERLWQYARAVQRENEQIALNEQLMQGAAGACMSPHSDASLGLLDSSGFINTDDELLNYSTPSAYSSLGVLHSSDGSSWLGGPSVHSIPGEYSSSSGGSLASLGLLENLSFADQFEAAAQEEARLQQEAALRAREAAQQAREAAELAEFERLEREMEEEAREEYEAAEHLRYMEAAQRAREAAELAEFELLERAMEDEEHEAAEHFY